MDLSPEDRRVLSLACAARTPDAHDKARVAARLALALGASAGVVSSVPSAQAAASGSLSSKSAASFALLKWWVGAGALLTAALGGYLTLSSPAAPAAVTPAGSTQAPTSAAAEALPDVPAALDPSQASAPRADPRPSVVEARPRARERRPERARQTRNVGRRAAAKAGASLPAELELLHEAQAAWRAGRAADARGLLRDHQRRYPHSALGLERGSLEVLTLCDLGDQAAARKLARTLLSAAPDSPLRTSIEQSCALK